MNREVELRDGQALMVEVMADPSVLRPGALMELQERVEELLAPLTHRERAVAQLLAQGLKQREVAAILRITPGRVSQLIASIREKLKKVA